MEAAVWIVAGIAVLYLVVRLGRAWMIPTTTNAIEVANIVSKGPPQLVDSFNFRYWPVSTPSGLI